MNQCSRQNAIICKRGTDASELYSCVNTGTHKKRLTFYLSASRNLFLASASSFFTAALSRKAVVPIRLDKVLSNRSTASFCDAVREPFGKVAKILIAAGKANFVTTVLRSFSSIFRESFVSLIECHNITTLPKNLPVNFMIKVTRALTFDPAESKLDKDWIIGAGSAALTSSSNALKPEVLTFAFVEAIALHKAGRNAVICGVSMIGYFRVVSMPILR